jgi:hypothetical protein
MSKEKLSNKVLQKIKKENLKPKPKWGFLLKNYIFWGAFGLSILIGGLASSVAIFRITTADWDIARRLGQHPISFGLRTMPYFWLIILAAFAALAYYNFKHTKEGFKFRLPLTITASILGSIVLGFAFFGAGIAKNMDEQALKHIPLYESMHSKQRVEMWSQIEKGLIAGEILEIQEGSIKIENLKGEEWTINTENVSKKMIENLKEGMAIGAIGETLEEGIFKAEDLRQWKGNFLEQKRINHLPIPMKEMKGLMRTI